MPAGPLPDVSPGKKKENNAMKKIMIAFLAVMLVCSGILSASFAETSGMYEYTLKEDGTAEITKVDPNCKDKEIPSELDGHPVTSIGEIAFKCGFADSNYFSALFRRKRGMTPTQCRRSPQH